MQPVSVERVWCIVCNLKMNIIIMLFALRCTAILDSDSAFYMNKTRLHKYDD